ncbi:hypothetical protein [Anatilimnocola floriformis]|uniref:hypothetical protein n=1 Tax=Anatilimnocola floriformis TaxID=2948575 RepID=UPI0020C2A5ED|nr:hypothetical protein [Anatilimnocola floriformis]
MREIPDFEEHLATVKATVGRDFDFAHRMWDAWMHLPKEPFVFASKLDPMAGSVAMTLNVQACRQMRSVILLCEACEAGNALIVARSIYETAVALQWILAPSVNLGFEPVLGKTDAWKVSTKSIDANLASRKRAAMYLAINVFNDENRFARWEHHEDHAQLRKRLSQTLRISQPLKESLARSGPISLEISQGRIPG